jgi:hemolysin III
LWWLSSLSASNQMDIFWWLVAGRLFYTVGAIIYLLKKIEYMLGGSVCHAYAIWLIG